MIDVKTISSYNWYLDFYEEIGIFISSGLNGEGEVKLDVFENEITGIVNNGKNYIYPVNKSLVYPIIIYDDIEFLYIDTIKDYMKFLIKPTNPIKYHYKANKTSNPTIDEGKILTDLTNKTIFKLFINGNEVLSCDYTSDNTGIASDKITGVNDYVELYTYEEGAELDNALLFNYNSTKRLIPNEEYIDNLRNIKNFTSMDVSENIETQSINQTYKKKKKEIRTNKTGEINITMFEDIRNLLRGETFRLIGYSPTSREIVIYTNCDFINSSQLNRSYNIDEIPYTIRYEDEIYGELSGGNDFYGGGIYGVGIYGGNVLVEVIE